MIKAIFMGTPQYAIPSLQALVDMPDIDVIAVVCQPDRAKDRKGNYIFSPVKLLAMQHNIPVYQFEKIRRDGVQTLTELEPDIMITCAYGQILSQEILDIPKYGVLNVHGSILPEYRGSSPLQWTLINGAKTTGVTLMKTDIGMDTGDCLAVKSFEVPDDMYIDELFELSARVGADLLKENLALYLGGKLIGQKQDESRATKCVMLRKEDALIDWREDCVKLRNKVRGIGYGYTFLNGEMLKIFKLSCCDGSGAPGKIDVCGKKIIVYCGTGAVSLDLLQSPNKKKLTSKEFLNGTRLQSGEILTLE